MKKCFLTILYLLSGLSCFAQIRHKIMIIPFEPKLYMSQIDHRINAETKLTQKQIKEEFRKYLNAEFATSLRSKMEVLDLEKDTTKYKKDILTIYKNITFKYQKVPDQTNYKAPAEEKNNKGPQIKNGQVSNETSSEERFMNAEITNASLVPNLFAKYKTDLFLFVNQIDIISVTTDEMGLSAERTLTLHYTVYTVDAKEINSGICRMKFPSNVNTPSKISSGYGSKIADEITHRILLALSKLESAPKK